MIQINIPNHRLVELAPLLEGRRIGIYREARGLDWYPVTRITQHDDQVQLIFEGIDYDEDTGDFITVPVTISRPLDGRTAAYLPEQLADHILAQLQHPAPIGA